MKSTEKPVQRVGLARVLAAQLYDALLVLALLICATGLVVGVMALLGAGARFEDGNPLVAHPLFQLYLGLVMMGFFLGFWLRGGQTLGMRAWQIRLRDRRGEPVRPAQALARFLGALLSWLSLGLGYLWMLLDREGLSWHDRLSGTRLEHHRRR